MALTLTKDKLQSSKLAITPVLLQM